MKEYGITAEITFSTNIRPEAGMQEKAVAAMRGVIQQDGLDHFLSLMTWGEEFEQEISEDVVLEELMSGERLIPVDGMKEFLVAVASGLTDGGELTQERAAQLLQDWDDNTGKDS